MSDVTALEYQLAGAKELIERRNRANRLAQNPDFKALILDWFCIQECARYAQASANPALGENERADSLNMAQAAGHLRRFLSVTMQMGNQAESQLAELEQTIAEARAEEDAE